MAGTCAVLFFLTSHGVVGSVPWINIEQAILITRKVCEELMEEDFKRCFGGGQGAEGEVGQE